MNYRCSNAAKLRAKGEGGSSEGRASQVPPSLARRSVVLVGRLQLCSGCGQQQKATWFLSGLAVRAFCCLPVRFFLKSSGYSDIGASGLFMGAGSETRARMQIILFCCFLEKAH